MSKDFCADMKKRHYATVSVHVSEALKIGAERAAEKAKARSLSAFLGAVVAERVIADLGEQTITEIERSIEARARAESAATPSTAAVSA